MPAEKQDALSPFERRGAFRKIGLRHSARVWAFPRKRLAGIDSNAGGIRKIDIKLFSDISLAKMYTMALTKRGGRFSPGRRRRVRLSAPEESRGLRTKIGPGADRPAPEKMFGRVAC